MPSKEILSRPVECQSNDDKAQYVPSFSFPLLFILHTAADNYLLIDPGLSNMSLLQSKNSGNSRTSQSEWPFWEGWCIFLLGLLCTGKCEPWNPNKKKEFGNFLPWLGKDSCSFSVEEAELLLCCEITLINFVRFWYWYLHIYNLMSLFYLIFFTSISLDLE